MFFLGSCIWSTLNVPICYSVHTDVEKCGFNTAFTQCLGTKVPLNLNKSMFYSMSDFGQQIGKYFSITGGQWVLLMNSKVQFDWQLDCDDMTINTHL